MTTMRSVQSFGGPLILLPYDAVPSWTGSYGPGGDDEVDEEETEYWRVSELVQDYAEPVDVAGVEALVLANGKAPTTFLPDLGLLVQVLAHGTRTSPVDRAREVLPRLERKRVTEWQCGGPGLLFDSARYGPEVHDADGLPVNLVADRYRVASGYWLPADDGDSSLALTTIERMP
ncbi:hypothetical protein J2S43_002792 [Catenuloplanes nepalensis]|uniref:Immunity protein 21 of polymorphic toxin system n=1 Tax=Catenuloplanes nepalensis TaxID=587533 RepID=A0ABT9MS84_9ACTN|nr:Imm21 family immunity protein [Catenuloplanes nepalensis]MDP9794280.1 hypothetical protein [Catenuloplanes nepalensis]